MGIGPALEIPVKIGYNKKYLYKCEVKEIRMFYHFLFNHHL